MKVAIQGTVDSFHDVARKQFFGGDDELINCDTFQDVFKSLESDADVAVVAMENSLYGSINEVYDLVLRHNVWIGGEVYLHISHCLIALPASKLEEIEEVHSHPVALAQCEAFLDDMLPKAERFEHHDTAGSVVDIKKWNDPVKAAIASKAAATAHKMKVLAENIETNPHNYTRFVVVYPNRIDVKGANKTSMILRTGHKPGALYRALGAFAENDINLSKLESRPIIGTRWEYMFYVDVEAAQDDPALLNALKQLRSNAQQAEIIGSYRRGSLPELKQ